MLFFSLLLLKSLSLVTLIFGLPVLPQDTDYDPFLFSLLHFTLISTFVLILLPGHYETRNELLLSTGDLWMSVVTLY